MNRVKKFFETDKPSRPAQFETATTITKKSKPKKDTKPKKPAYDDSFLVFIFIYSRLPESYLFNIHVVFEKIS